MGLSPMMQRYFELKEHYKDCLVFYRLGDFYEMFFDDAKTASRELQLTLTGRDCGLSERAPMCGVPHHSVNTYINKLLAKNYKVAICEQLSDPKLSKGLVERDVVRVVTPGTIIEDDMLSGSTNNFIAAVCILNSSCGVAWADVSTGEFFLTNLACEASLNNVSDRLLKINPNEIIVNEEFLSSSTVIPRHVVKQLRPFSCEGEIFTAEKINENLFARFKSSEKFNKKYPAAIKSAAALWEYLVQTQKNSLTHFKAPEYIEPKEYLFLDSTCVRNLEVFKSLGDHGTRGSLMWLLDKTRTPMGTRKLYSSLERPLRNKDEINFRLDGVQELSENYALLQDLDEALGDICDIERVCSHIAYGNVTPKETVSIRRALNKLPKVKELLKDSKSDILNQCSGGIDTLEDVYTLLYEAIDDKAPEKLMDGGIVRDGYSKDLDKFRSAVKNGQKWITELETREKEDTGIKTLKIKYNRVFGYTIEVTNSFKEKVPLNYIRRRTLSGSECYVTEELKQIEEMIVGGEEKALKLELEIFDKVRQTLLESLPRIRRSAESIAMVDMLYSLALVASESNFVRPEINEEGILEIIGGRHPVVEKMLTDVSFVANDTYLNPTDTRFMIITGPNMAGKSTYMRQTAIIALLAHVGSFVPAQKANVCLCDRLFTRVGASDDLSAGQSTFMVEMNEVASILSTATKNSLVILDEIGRGTSTFDGLSIAWSVTEYIAKNIGAKTLFATHYHELSELEGTLEGVKNYCITAKEYGDDVIFLRKIVRGSADKSFGIAVANLAGVPNKVILRAKEILKTLEQADIVSGQGVQNSVQASMFVSDNNQEIINQLKDVDINTLTPIQAINILCELREKAKREL